MITVILMSIVLLVVVIGLVQLMLNEQRQSSDNELTNRAFYAAEAGLESARQYVSELSSAEITALSSTPLADAECLTGANKLQGDIDPVLIGDASYEAEVICQKISGVGGTYTIGPEIGINNAKQYDLGNNKDSLEVQWAIKETGPAPTFRGSTALPVPSSWSSPAVIRLQLFGFESNVNRARLLDLNKEFYLIPATTAAGSTTHSYVGSAGPVLAECDSGVTVGQKMCSVNITGIPTGAGTNAFVRISYLYDTTTTDLTPRSGGSVAAQLPGQLRVDTTGRVGDVYRRIQANIDVSNQAADDLPAYTLVGNQVCKSFEITDDPADYDSINNSDPDYCANN